MATTSPSYGAVTAMTITLANRGAGLTQGRASTAVSNTTTLATDYYISGKITTGTAPSTNSFIHVYVGSSDGTIFPANATGTDADVTFSGEDSQLVRLISIPNSGTSNQTYEFGQLSLCAALGLPFPPRSFIVVVVNDTGVSLNATASTHVINYEAIGTTSV